MYHRRNVCLLGSENPIPMEPTRVFPHPYLVLVPVGLDPTVNHPEWVATIQQVHLLRRLGVPGAQRAIPLLQRPVEPGHQMANEGLQASVGRSGLRANLPNQIVAYPRNPSLI